MASVFCASLFTGKSNFDCEIDGLHPVDNIF
jgi:hypothetical protein